MKKHWQTKNNSLLVVLLSCWVSEGGIQQVNRSLLKLFAQFENCDVTVLVLLDQQTDIKSAIQKNSNIKKIKIRGFFGNKVKFTVAYLNELLHKRYSAIWFDHINLAPFMIIANIMRIAYSMMVHGIEVLRPLSFIKKVALSKAKKVISVSNHTKMMAQNWSNVFKKAEVCPLGIDLQLSQPLSNNSVKEHKHVLRDRRTILIVARMDANEVYSKGHQELIETVALLKERLPEILLIIVGRGSAKSMFERLVVERKIENNVLFTGFVPDEKLHSYYKHCDVFAMPSRGEGFGLVYLEAMAYGKPCIGSNADAAKEVISDGEAGYCVNPDNIEELAERLFQLLTDSELRKKMGKAGQKRYLENFTEQKFHERFRRIIGDV
jgi:glycosyltransferase involved in cell wall biosynthesis